MTTTIWRGSPEVQRAVMLLCLENTVRRDPRWSLVVEDGVHRLLREEGALVGRVWPQDISRQGCPREYTLWEDGALVEAGMGEAFAVFSRVNARLDNPSSE